MDARAYAQIKEDLDTKDCHLNANIDEKQLRSKVEDQFSEDLKEVAEDIPLVLLPKKKNVSSVLGDEFLEYSLPENSGTTPEFQFSETSTLASAFGYEKKKNMLEPMDSGATKMKDMMKKRRPVKSPERIPDPEPVPDEPKIEVVTIEEESDLEIDEQGIPLKPEMQFPVYNPLQAATRREKSKNGRRRKWQTLETELFYKLIKVTGVNFDMMSEFMPSRTADEHRAKYKKEYKVDFERMSQTLSSPGVLDSEVLEEIKKQDVENEKNRNLPLKMKQAQKREEAKQRTLKARTERKAAKAEAALKQNVEKKQQRAAVKAQLLARKVGKTEESQKYDTILCQKDVSETKFDYSPKRKTARLENTQEKLALE
ncbi:unnamed protein product [Caenorhabditis auriculariae]|uniref:Transcription factor TFIIIB component B'' Myb domain-containing protein n=1 Tax=Caenorhabditis auriculariae TaxID=2777116 RepID=A0A8S1HI70_9PELO|nr:unnamed protein product [Caenorhabditis auriculariae]